MCRKIFIGKKALTIIIHQHAVYSSDVLVAMVRCRTSLGVTSPSWSRLWCTGGRGYAPSQQTRILPMPSPSLSGRGGRMSRVRTTGNSSTTSESIAAPLPKTTPMDTPIYHTWSCRFMEDHSTSSLIWNYKVVILCSCLATLVWRALLS